MSLVGEESELLPQVEAGIIYIQCKLQNTIVMYVIYGLCKRLVEAVYTTYIIMHAPVLWTCRQHTYHSYLHFVAEFQGILNENEFAWKWILFAIIGVIIFAYDFLAAVHSLY